MCPIFPLFTFETTVLWLFYLFVLIERHLDHELERVRLLATDPVM